jgi:hypothetical protein
MGYRSDVAYTIRFTKAEDYHLFVLEAKAKPEVAGALGECDLDDKRFRIDFEAENIKWYESYPHVQMHEKLIDQAESWCEDDTHIEVSPDTPEKLLFEGKDYRLGFVFVRVGEDDGDNERRDGGNSAYDWLHITRQIIEG